MTLDWGFRASEEVSTSEIGWHGRFNGLQEWTLQRHGPWLASIFFVFLRWDEKTQLRASCKSLRRNGQTQSKHQWLQQCEYHLLVLSIPVFCCQERQL